MGEGRREGQTRVRILIGLSVVCLAVMALISVVLWTADPLRSGRLVQPEVVSVRLWRVPGQSAWDSTEIDLRSARIRIVGTSLPGSTPGCRAIKAKLGKSEIEGLRTMIQNADLESFLPKAEWFHSSAAYHEGGADLQIRYGTGEVVFAIPPPGVECRLPDYAAHRYERIAEIVHLIAKLHNRQIASGPRSRLLAEGQCLSVLRECEAPHEMSLPRGRRGW